MQRKLKPRELQPFDSIRKEYQRKREMGKLCAIFWLVLVAVHASHARNVPSGVGLDSQQTKMANSPKEQTMQATIAPEAESPKGNGIDDKKNFIYGGVGGFAGMGGFAGVAGGLPLVGGLGGIGKYGGIGGAAGIGGYSGLGGLGGAGAAGGVGGLGGGSGIGGASGSGLGGSTGSGILPSP